MKDSTLQKVIDEIRKNHNREPGLEEFLFLSEAIGSGNYIIRPGMHIVMTRYGGGGAGSGGTYITPTRLKGNK